AGVVVSKGVDGERFGGAAGGVHVVSVVADGRLGHGPAHPFGGLGERVAAKFDHGSPPLAGTPGSVVHGGYPMRGGTGGAPAARVRPRWTCALSARGPAAAG